MDKISNTNINMLRFMCATVVLNMMKLKIFEGSSITINTVIS